MVGTRLLAVDERDDRLCYGSFGLIFGGTGSTRFASEGYLWEVVVQRSPIKRDKLMMEKDQG